MDEIAAQLKVFYGTQMLALGLYGSLARADLPDGHDKLCQLIITGNLSDRDRGYAACERYWRGLQTWLGAHGISINQQLDTFLAS